MTLAGCCGITRNSMVHIDREYLADGDKTPLTEVAFSWTAVVWASLEETAHSPNEYCVIDNLVGDALVLAHLFARGS